MISFIVGIVVIFLILLFVYGLFNYQLKGMMDTYVNGKEIQENFTTNRMEEASIRPIDECVKNDMKGDELLHTNCSHGIPNGPFDYKYYVGDVYIPEPTNPELGRKNGKYCVGKQKLLFDGIWSPHIFAKEGYETTKWKLTNGNVTEGEICMKSLYNTLKPMPTELPPDCPVKCLKESDIGVYCNGPPDNDKQDITDPNDEQVICFPSIFTPYADQGKTLSKVGF